MFYGQFVNLIEKNCKYENFITKSIENLTKANIVVGKCIQN